MNWNNLFINAPTLSHTVSQPGTYFVRCEATDNTGTMVYDQQIVFVNCAGFRGANPNEPQNYIIKKIYPNPTATDDVTVVIELQQNEEVQLYITDINGNFKKTVTDELMTEGKNTLTFSVADLVAGSYHLNLSTETQKEYHLLIIKK